MFENSESNDFQFSRNSIKSFMLRNRDV